MGPDDLEGCGSGLQLEHQGVLAYVNVSRLTTRERDVYLKWRFCDMLSPLAGRIL